jgi:helix-hairpin-helix protein
MDADRDARPRAAGDAGRRGVLARRFVAGLKHLGHAATVRATGLVTAMSYRGREVLLVALLAMGLLGGAGVEGWRERHPDLARRLEAEPPRLASVAGARIPRQSSAEGPALSAPAREPGRTASQRAARASCPPGARAVTGGRRVTPSAADDTGRPSPDHPLDLNRATGADLAQLPGIGPRLSDRILRQRALLGGEFRSPDDLAIVPGLGARRAGLLRPLVTITPRWRGPTESDLPDSGPPAGAGRAADGMPSESPVSDGERGPGPAESSGPEPPEAQSPGMAHPADEEARGSSSSAAPRDPGP